MAEERKEKSKLESFAQQSMQMMHPWPKRVFINAESTRSLVNHFLQVVRTAEVIVKFDELLRTPFLPIVLDFFYIFENYEKCKKKARNMKSLQYFNIESPYQPKLP